MLHCNKNRYKSVDVQESLSNRLLTHRFNSRHSRIEFDYMFDRESWDDFRLIEILDKVYGNHR